MPFAQVHYPFENREWFDGHYPGDFIVEYIGQTRDWFFLPAGAGLRAVRPAKPSGAPSDTASSSATTARR